jgi:hypothetical protein
MKAAPLCAGIMRRVGLSTAQAAIQIRFIGAFTERKAA